jgi:hypothetical protein
MKFLILIIENFSLCNNSITNFTRQFSSVFPQGIEIKHLGRWNIDRDDSIVNKKIDLSNYDHCGTCGIETQRSRIQNKTKS